MNKPGQLASKEILIDLSLLKRSYYENKPSPADLSQRVLFGTSGHRGTSLNGTFTESHILAITQAICDFRKKSKINGPIYVGKDTHALSVPAEQTAIEVLAANEQTAFVSEGDFTPTPVISHSILCFNRSHPGISADGIVITPSHNPPSDGGFKYNPPSGGPADTKTTKWIQERANEIIGNKLVDVRRVPLDLALKSPFIKRYDFVHPYIRDLGSIIDFRVLRDAKLKIGVDPLGGSSLEYWRAVSDVWDINLEVVNDVIDPRFAFMTIDHDGKIRMDCSSKDAMANLICLKESYDIAFGNDPDSDRHGIVTRSGGLMNPNHYLAVAIRYLFTHRTNWGSDLGIGKTLVSSAIIDRVSKSLNRQIFEVPVGFKWFVDGLFNEKLGFCGEESAGASFLRIDGTVWCTDKDGIIMNLLSAEILAATGKDPAEQFEEITNEFGSPFYKRLDQPCSEEEKRAFSRMTPDLIKVSSLGDEPIDAKIVNAPGNNEPIGGLKIVTKNGWCALRPSGTENIYKIYAESFRSENHLLQIIEKAKKIINSFL